MGTEEETSAKAREFVDRLDAAIIDIFGEGGAAVVVGLEVEGFAVLTSNLSPCAVGQAIHDMHNMAITDHDRYHSPDGPAPFMVVDPDTVDGDVREHAERIAKETGIPVENIVFRQAIDMSDLDDPQSGLNIPDPGPIVTTGDDDIAAPPIVGTKHGVPLEDGGVPLYETPRETVGDFKPSFDMFPDAAIEHLTAKDEADIAALNADEED